MELLGLLQSTPNYKATSPRDKAYALLGLASDAKAGGLSADYNKPTVEVYQDVVRFMILTQGNLDIISAGKYYIS
jgi:hypothetical protein